MVFGEDVGDPVAASCRQADHRPLVGGVPFVVQARREDVAVHGIPVATKPQEHCVLGIQGHLVLDKQSREPNFGRPFRRGRGVVFVQRVPQSPTRQHVVDVAQGFVPGQLAEGDVLRGDVRHVSVGRILAMPVGAELQHQPLRGGQLIRAKGLPPVGVNAFAITLRTSAMRCLDPVHIAPKTVLVDVPAAKCHDAVVFSVDAPSVEQRHPVLKWHVGELVVVAVHTPTKVEGIHPKKALDLVVETDRRGHVGGDFPPCGPKDVGREGRGVAGRFGDDVDQSPDSL